MNKNKDINPNKLKEDILSLRKTILNLNFQKSSGQLEKTSQIKTARREIARLKTKLKNLIGDKNA